MKCTVVVAIAAHLSLTSCSREPESQVTRPAPAPATSSFNRPDTMDYPRLPVTVVAISDEKLERRNGVLYLANVPFSGYVEELFESGPVRSRTGYWGGVRSGVATKWFASGTPFEERFYLEGRKQGLHHGWWEDGTLRFVAGFRFGKNHGERRAWSSGGQLVELRHFVGGEEEGLQRSWTPDGRLLANYVVRGGRRYGLLGAKPCFTVSDGVQRFRAASTTESGS